MNVSTKLLLAFGFALSICLIIGGVGSLGANRLNEEIDSLYKSNFLPVTELSDLSLRAQSLHADTYRHVIAPDKNIMDTITKDMREDEQAVKEQLDKFRQSDMSPEEKETFTSAEAAWNRYLQTVSKALPLSEKGEDKEANDLLNGEGETAFHSLEKGLSKLVELNKVQARNAYQLADATGDRTTTLTAVVLFIGLMLLAGAAFVIMRNLTNQLGCEPEILVRLAHRIADGDFSRNDQQFSAPVGSVAAAMQQMQNQLRQTLREVSESAGQLNNSAQDIGGLANEASRRATAQNDSASSIAAAIEQLTVSVTHINDNAQHAQQQSQEAQQLANEGGSVIQKSIKEVERIEASVTETAGVISKLEEESAGISAIVKVIKEIADQTNLLALNAAIEAARAGEQGRGFAVVADEVRKLAERTGHSTQEISQLVQRIQSGTHKAAESMEAGLICVRSGVELSSKAGGAIDGIRRSVNNATQQVSDISASLSEQTSASTDIARNVEVISRMSQENSVSAENVSEASRHIGQLANVLQSEVSRFRF